MKKQLVGKGDVQRDVSQRSNGTIMMMMLMMTLNRRRRIRERWNDLTLEGDYFETGMKK